MTKNVMEVESRLDVVFTLWKASFVCVSDGRSSVTGSDLMGQAPHRTFCSLINMAQLTNALHAFAEHEPTALEGQISVLTSHSFAVVRSWIGMLPGKSIFFVKDPMWLYIYMIVFCFKSVDLAWRIAKPGNCKKRPSLHRNESCENPLVREKYSSQLSPSCGLAIEL